MVDECDQCPGKEAVFNYLKSKDFVGNKTDISYSNWSVVTQKKGNSETSTSRAVLNHFKERSDKFINDFVNDLWDITEHHFVAEAQKNYLTHCNKN